MTYDCLIIDDEKMLADSTAEYFSIFDIKTHAIYSKNEYLEFFKKHDAQLILLDINLQDGSGFEICKSLREERNLPVLFISARTSESDQIMAFHVGGDDYIQKPYSLSILLAKVKAVLKRNQKSISDKLTKGFRIDQANHMIYKNELQLKLTAMEYKLLLYLIENPNRIISKEELFTEVWRDHFTGDGTLNVHIRKIREQIEIDANKPQIILTVWREGYKFIGESL